MYFARNNKKYIDGVESFLGFAYSYGDSQGEEIQCPCAKYCYIRWTRRNVVYDYLICYVFVKRYTILINHGQWDVELNVDDYMNYLHDDIDYSHDSMGPNEDAKKFYNLVEEENL